MVIWRGWGVLALILASLCNVLMQVVTDSAFGIPEGVKHYRDSHGWVWLVGMGLSALTCWFAGHWLETREIKNAKIVTDKETGQDIRLIGRHDMFWIPVKWWALVWLVLGVWFALGK